MFALINTMLRVLRTMADRGKVTLTRGIKNFDGLVSPISLRVKVYFMSGETVEFPYLCAYYGKTFIEMMEYFEKEYLLEMLVIDGVDFKLVQRVNNIPVVTDVVDVEFWVSSFNGSYSEYINKRRRRNI